MIKYIQLLLILVFIIAKVKGENEKNLTIALYYESLCPDSRRFVINQLAPHYINDELINFIDLQIVPFGKADKTINSTDGSISFECQHGEPECWGNKLHSCIVEKYFENQENKENKIKTVQLINCTFWDNVDWRPNVTQPMQRCYQQIFNSDFNEIVNCATQRGNELLDKMGNLTNQLDPNLNYVPWITFNNVRNKDSEFNFLDAVCNQTLCNAINQTTRTTTINSFSFIIIFCFLTLFKLLFQSNP